MGILHIGEDTKSEDQSYYDVPERFAYPPSI